MSAVTVFSFDSLSVLAALRALGLSRFNLHLGTQHLSLETFINMLFTKRSFSVT